MKIPIEVSNRHVHLTRKDLDVLFGKNYQLTMLRQLSQPGEFAAKEQVTLLNGNKKIENVRVLGPERKETQVEILSKDIQTLGINPPIRDSGDLENTPGIEIKGPAGKIKLKKGVIIANRHLHITPEEAKSMNLNSSLVKIRLSCPNDKVLDNVVVRVSNQSKLAVHINKDDELAKFVDKNTYGEII